MNTWILLMLINLHHDERSSYSVVINDLPSYDECVRIEKVIHSTIKYNVESQCIEVRK